MLSRGASGNSDNNKITELARIVKANPWVKINSLIGASPKYGRSVVEREVLKLVESIGPDRCFTLDEVIELVIATIGESSGAQRLLVAPADLLDSIPVGQRVRSIPSYLEDIIRKTQREILLLAPFWDMPTLIDLFRCAPRESTHTELVLLLVYRGKRLPRVESIVNKIQFAWPLNRIRIYLHLANLGSSTNYPHAKCLIVDRSHGYLGSANFTSAGMKGHFEVGICLEPEDSRALAGILQYLWSQSGIFTLAWDSAESGTRT